MDLGPNPVLAATTDAVIAIGSGPDSNAAGAAQFDFSTGEWERLPDPPPLTSARAATTEWGIAMIGLAGCLELDCPAARPTVARLETGADEWTSAVIGDAIDSDAWALDDIGGDPGVGPTAFFTLGTSVLAADSDGVRISEQLPLDLSWRICSTERGSFAFAPTTDARSLPRDELLTPSLERGQLYALEPSFEDQAAWEPVPGSETIPLGRASAVTAGCSSTGVLLADADARKIHDFDGKWKSQRSEGAPPPGFVVAARVTPSGDSVLQTGSEVGRLARSGQAPAWRRAAARAQAGEPPTSMKIAVAGERVVAFEGRSNNGGGGSLRLLDI